MMMESIMSANNIEFTFSQTEYINSNIEVIEAAAKSNPNLFENCIDMIMKNFIIILKIMGNKENNEQFGTVMEAMTELTEKFN